MIRLIDDVGRDIVLRGPAVRVVSLVPSLTETICVFGCSAQLVGVTRHCTEPELALREVARIGGTKNPDVAAIIALQPDLVVANAEENRREDFDQLTEARLDVLVTYPRRVVDVPRLLRLLGRALGAIGPAETAAAELDQVLTRGPQSQRRKRVFCPIWKNPWMTFNRETFADDLLALAGASNVFRDRPERYFEVSLAEVAEYQPESILLPDEPYVFGRKDLPSLSLLEATPALRADGVRFVDGKALFWFGTRTASALPYLRGIVGVGGA